MDRTINEMPSSEISRRQHWFNMPVSEQLQNVGSEVHRAIRWKNRGDRIKAVNFCNKAIEFLRIMQEDPKNIHRTGEFEEGIYELQDYFQGENLYNTSDDVLIRYYDSFLEVYERTAG